MKIAVTLGDPNGIGPEVLLKGLPEIISDAKEILVYGHRSVLEFWNRLLSMRTSAWHSVRYVEPEMPSPPVHPGKVTREGGEASFAYVRMAVEHALRGDVHAVVTGPVSKEAWALAGSEYRGHTRLLGDQCGTGDFVMMLANPRLRVALVTDHVPLRGVPDLITRDAVAKTIRITASGVREMGVANPRIAVAGLNPHAGEAGLLGTEEDREITPAVRECGQEGILVSGPFPGDTVFHRAVEGQFDAVVAMYHDQGLAPLKAISFEDTVNVTLGLPIVRTSVGHGTGFDIAGRGVASPVSLVEAVQLAATMAVNRWEGSASNNRTRD